MKENTIIPWWMGALGGASSGLLGGDLLQAFGIACILIMALYVIERIEEKIEENTEVLKSINKQLASFFNRN